jgi:8-amino-7-oxononanoate synthase
MHNSVIDLRAVLQGIMEESNVVGERKGNVIVAVESIYSMDGDVAPLKAIVEAVEDIVGNEQGYIVVDEAHSTGVLGPQGRGLVCELQLENRIFARLHTFGKALASNGGKPSTLGCLGEVLMETKAIILGSPTLKHYLINYARPLIYTTFMSYPALALIRASYALLQSGQTVALQRHLHHLTDALYSSLHELCSSSPSARSFLQIPSACPESPIFSIQVQQPRNLAMVLQSHGMMVRAVVPPTVPMGTERVRVCLHAGNTEVQVQKLVGIIKQWCEDRLNTTVEDITTVSAKL